MSEISRRVFLKGGSVAVLAAGAISALPGLPAIAGVADTQPPADASTAEAVVTDTGSAVMSDPVIAHVRDLATGEIGVFSGIRETTLVDPQLAVRLAKAVG